MNAERRIHELYVQRLFEARRRILQSWGEFHGPGLAQRSGISRFHFIRLFHATFGETPHELGVQLRFWRAQKLLSETDLSVTEICFECGYESLGSFSHAFRQRLGCSPREFRQRHARAKFWPVNISFLERTVPFCLIDCFR